MADPLTDQPDIAEQLPVKPEDNFWHTDTVFTHKDGRAVIYRVYDRPSEIGVPPPSGYLGVGVISKPVNTPQGPGRRQVQFTFDIPNAIGVEDAFHKFHQHLESEGKKEAQRLQAKDSQPRILVPGNTLPS